MIDEKDFSGQKYFPGTTGNPFDSFLHLFERIREIPSTIFGITLFLIALIVFQTRWVMTLGLFGFFIIDWILLGSLPRAGKSFGPAKPPVILLALARSVIALLPLYLSIPLEVAGVFLIIYGFWFEPHTIQVTRQFLITPKLPAGKSFRMLHLGDLHVERITARERQLNRLVAELAPDIILFSGDFINLSYLRDPASWEAARTIIQAWQAPGGVYGVTGSPAVDLDEIIPQIVKDTPLRLLDGEKLTLSVNHCDIDLLGISCSHKPFVDGPRLNDLASAPSNHFTILLYHSPDLAPVAAQAGIDLQLSGHTHGGQVRLPLIGALFTGSLYGKTFEAGRISINHLILYITRGIGMEGAGAPRVRFLCPPELILWEISGPKNG